MSRLRKSESGSAMLVTLALILMFSGIGIMAIRRADTDVDISFNKVRRDQAFQLADASVARAMVSLNADSAWRTGFSAEPFGSGHFWAAVLDSSSGLMTGDTLMLDAKGEITGDPSSTVQLEAWLVPVREQPFKYAIFGYERLRMKGTACTDSYNSDSGTYADTHLDEGAPVGSNLELRLRDNVVVNGDAITTDMGFLDMDSTATVNGDVITDPSFEVPPVIVPASEFAWAKTVNAAPAGINGSGSAYTYVNDDLIIDVSETVTLSSGVYFFNDIEIRAGGSLQIEPGASVTIYSDGQIDIRDSASFNGGGKPSDLIIYSDDGILRVEDEAEFRGAFLGHLAEFKMLESSKVYGSIAVEREELDPDPGVGGCFHYDRGLAKFERGRIETFRKFAWREK